MGQGGRGWIGHAYRGAFGEQPIDILLFYPLRPLFRPLFPYWRGVILSLTWSGNRNWGGAAMGEPFSIVGVGADDL